MLTEIEAKNAASRQKDYKLSDFAGMYLLVRPTGSRLWRLRYRLDGKEKCMSLGVYPTVSLAEARKHRDHVKTQLRSGIDPMAARRAGRAQQRARRERRDFRLSLSDAGELTVSTHHQSFRLSAQHTTALRAFLIAASESRSESQRARHAAQ